RAPSIAYRQNGFVPPTPPCSSPVAEMASFRQRLVGQSHSQKWLRSAIHLRPTPDLRARLLEMPECFQRPRPRAAAARNLALPACLAPAGNGFVPSKPRQGTVCSAEVLSALRNGLVPPTSAAAAKIVKRFAFNASMREIPPANRPQMALIGSFRYPPPRAKKPCARAPPPPPAIFPVDINRNLQ
ncbi:MAG TPA: hypothetical protein VMU19_14040, partial [Bryobacteraceae bacterium]|nr:hypothetical protein [Bryobacteraceae bacterium]